MDFFKNNIAIIAGIAIGAIAGYLYYHFVGCNGSCLISSNPFRSVLYGALLGGLAVNAFQKKKVKEDIS